MTQYTLTDNVFLTTNQGEFWIRAKSLVVSFKDSRKKQMDFSERNKLVSVYKIGWFNISWKKSPYK